MKISIIIPWYNTESLVDIHLSKVVEASKNPKNNIKEIIVVDDASKDKSVEFIKQKFPIIRLIRHKKNRGFSSTVNTGVRMAKGELVCLLNSDVSPETNFLEKIASDFGDDNVFGVSLNEIGVFGWAKGGFKDGFIVHAPGGKSELVHNTFWVSGGTGVYRRKTWIKIGGMDEKLFTPFYWEDLDLSYRAMKRGYILLWEPDAKVTHNHETTIGKISKSKVLAIQERNHLLFMWKNVTSKRLFGKHITGLLGRIAMHPGYLKIVFLALLKLSDIVKLRSKEVRESKVSDEAILARFS